MILTAQPAVTLRIFAPVGGVVESVVRGPFTNAQWRADHGTGESYLLIPAAQVAKVRQPAQVSLRDADTLRAFPAAYARR